MTTRSPANEVFKITELALLIVQNLSPEALYHMQYVNKKLFDIVRSRELVLQHLFLEPVPGGPVKPFRVSFCTTYNTVFWFPTRPPTLPGDLRDRTADRVDRMASDHCRALRLLRSRAPSPPLDLTIPPLTIPPQNWDPAVLATQSEYGGHWSKPYLCPVLKNRFPEWSYHPYSNLIMFEKPVPKTVAWQNPDASWRRMLLMQPPLAEARIMKWDGRMFKARNRNGLTMGDVMDAIYSGLDYSQELGVDSLTWLQFPGGPESRVRASGTVLKYPIARPTHYSWI